MPDSSRTADDDIRVRIAGMDCVEEVSILKRELRPLVGDIDRLQFDVLNRKLTVRGGLPHVAEAELVAAVAQTGMQAEPWTESPRRPAANRWRLGLTVLSGLLGLGGLLVHAWLGGGFAAALGSEGLGINAPVPQPALLLYLAGIAAGVWYVVPRAWLALRRLAPDMNLLMFIAVCGAAILGEWFEAVTVSFLFSLSLLLESWSVGRARRAIAALMDLTPLQARIRTADGQETTVPPANVALGQVFSVRPGEKIPLDGVVQAGHSAVNQAPITGESVPVDKQPGDEVFAGTINGDGTLQATCTKAANDTTLARIIHLVEAAQGNRAPRRAMGREIRPLLHPDDHARGPGAARVPAAVGRHALECVVLSGLGAVGDCLPVCPGDFDAGDHRRRPRIGGAAWRAGQRGRVPRSPRPPAGDRAGQDGDPHRGQTLRRPHSCRSPGIPRRNCSCGPPRWKPRAIIRWPGRFWPRPESATSNC